MLKEVSDINWFSEGQWHKKYKNVIKPQDLYNIFTVDIEERKWYYIILKTFEPKRSEEISILKFTEAID